MGIEAILSDYELPKLDYESKFGLMLPLRSIAEVPFDAAAAAAFNKIC